MQKKVSLIMSTCYDSAKQDRTIIKKNLIQGAFGERQR